jgi:CRISPR-associated protein Csd1
MKAILNGTPYPRTLLVAAVRRGKAESPGRAKDNKERGEILRREFVRAALIKAVLVRANRSNPKEVGMALDRENGNIGYRLGRLFALLERCQETVSPGLNATIKDRYYGSASGTPVVAFPLLLRLNQNHLKKLKQEKPGYAVNLDKEIGEIIGGIEGKFPATLDLDNQGRFAIGYYHQRQNFFKKKETKEEEKA